MDFSNEGEFDPLIENNTFEWQKAPQNKNIISSRWFFYYKKSNRSHKYNHIYQPLRLGRMWHKVNF